jgi:hypothetical protein
VHYSERQAESNCRNGESRRCIGRSTDFWELPLTGINASANDISTSTDMDSGHCFVCIYAAVRMPSCAIAWKSLPDYFLVHGCTGKVKSPAGIDQ